MRIGIFMGSMGAAFDLERRVQHVVATEDDGFDGFWSAQTTEVDALALIALAGQRTRRIEMGTAVVPTYARHPVALAQHALTAQAASGGRVTLGIGLSHKPSVEGSAEFAGQVFRVNASIQVPSAAPFPIVIAALGPRMLRVAGELAEGTVTWMVGRKTLETHIVPRINAAADAAGRPKPRVCVGVPVAVTDDPAAPRERAARIFRRYGDPPSYRRMLAIEGVQRAGDVALVGNEGLVETRLRELADAGATDLLASIFPVDDDAEASVVRTRALLKSLVGKI